MANLSNKLILPQRVAVIYYKLQSTTSKLQRTASNIGFTKKVLHNEVIPKFAKVSAQFKNYKDKWYCSRRILVSHLQDHQRRQMELIKTQRELNKQLKQVCGEMLCRILIKKVFYFLSKERYSMFQTKNRKLRFLLQYKQKNVTFSVPIVNLSDHSLTKLEKEQLKLGLEHSYIDKNKHQRKFLAANFETIAQKVNEDIPHDKKEHFHEFLRAYTDIFITNIKNSKDYTYKNLKGLINDKETVVIKADKDSSVVLMKRVDYINKLEEMIQDGIRNGTYKQTDDTTLKDLKQFQSFLYRNFSSHRDYKKMTPSSNQPARLYGTAKTHKFNSTEDVTKSGLKFRPIIDQTGTYTYKTAQIIGEYLKPLSKNEYTIKDTQQFPDMIKQLPPLSQDEEYVSYDVESLFTNVPLHETIDYIIEEIYINKKLKPLCNKLIFKRLLTKLTTECTFTFNNKFYRQADGCAMGGPLSVIMADIFMVKMENDIVKPMNPLFYKRYLDDIIYRRKIENEDRFLKSLNSYHPKAKKSTQLNS